MRSAHNYGTFKYVPGTKVIFLRKNPFFMKKNYYLLPNLVFTASDVRALFEEGKQF
jgi:hypothetical protein